MNIAKNKFVRKASAFLFSAVFAVLAAIPAVYAEPNYGQIPSDRIKFVVKQSGWLDIIRIVLWKILVGCAQLIDSIYQAINKLMEVNIYDMWIKKIPFFSSGIGKIAAALAGVSNVFAAIYFVAFYDKAKHLDMIRSILLVFITIVALPALISCMSDIRSISIKSLNNTPISDSSDSTTSVPKSIGQTLLGSVTYIAQVDGSNAKVQRLDELRGWGNLDPYSVDINQVNMNSDWTKYPSGNGFTSSLGGTKNFNELTIENKLVLLGCYDNYILYQNIVGTENTVAIFKGTVDRNGVKQYDHLTADELSEKIIAQINSVCGVSLPLNTSISSAVFDPQVEEKLIDLNYKNNQDYINTGDSVFRDDSNQYFWLSLRDDDDQKKADAAERILGAIRNLGTYQEYVYTYDCDFFFGYVIVLATLISLVYAGYRLASLLYDVMFIQIIAPLFIVTDMHGTGRAKKVINNLVNTNIVIIVVFALIKIYLICAVGIVSSSLSFVVKLFLLMGGVKFVTDGPDIVAKILGIDAGVRHGAASIMSLYYSTQMGLGTVRAGASLARSAVGTVAGAGHRAAHIGGNIVGGVARAPGAVKTAVNNAQEHRWEKQAENTARNEAGLSRTEYRDIKRDAAKQERADRKASAKQERFDRASAAGKERFENIYSHMHSGGDETSAPRSETAQAPTPDNDNGYAIENTVGRNSSAEAERTTAPRNDTAQAPMPDNDNGYTPENTVGRNSSAEAERTAAPRSETAQAPTPDNDNGYTPENTVGRNSGTNAERKPARNTSEQAEPPASSGKGDE